MQNKQKKREKGKKKKKIKKKILENKKYNIQSLIGKWSVNVSTQPRPTLSQQINPWPW